MHQVVPLYNFLGGTCFQTPLKMHVTTSPILLKIIIILPYLDTDLRPW